MQQTCHFFLHLIQTHRCFHNEMMPLMHTSLRYVTSLHVAYLECVISFENENIILKFCSLVFLLLQTHAASHQPWFQPDVHCLCVVYCFFAGIWS